MTPDIDKLRELNAIVKYACTKLDVDGSFCLNLEVDGAPYKIVRFATERQRDAAYSDFAQMMDDVGSLGLRLQ